MKKTLGFTIAEMIIVLGLFGLIMVIGLPIGIDSYRDYLLFSETRNLLSILRRSQNLAMANNYQANYGVYFSETDFVLFQGSTFALRNQTFDEYYLKSTAVTVSGPTEIVFAPISGSANSSTTIILSNNVRSREININGQGAISW